MIGSFLATAAMGQLNEKSGINVFRELQNVENYHDSFSKGERLDSTLFKTWDEVIPGWVNSMKEVSSYATGSRVDITYLWDKTNIPNKWIYSVKSEYHFNGDGDMTSVIAYAWDNTSMPNKWIGTTKTENTFVNGNNTLSTRYTWGGNAWAQSSKTESTYNASGNILVEITSMYLFQWMNVSKTEHSYDAGGKDILETHYDWDMIATDWTVDSKTENTYNANGKIATATSSDWDKTLTVPAWVKSDKTEYVYNSDGNVTSMSMYEWNTSTSLWDGFMKMETFYTANEITGFIIYHWDKVVNPATGWVNFSKEEQTASGTLPSGVKYVEMTGSEWDVNKWVNSDKDTYYYSGQSTSIFNNSDTKGIRVYPNPAKEFIVFNLSDIPESAVAEIYDIQGRKVLEHKISQNRQISVSNLSTGLYIYKLYTNGVIYKGKLLIK